MLRFRGSDCRRSCVLTWYDKMDRLLMTLGFTKSKADSNLYYKVDDGNPVMLLLYVDDLFVAEYRWNLPCTREVCSRDPEEVWDDGLQGYGYTYGIEPEAIE